MQGKILEARGGIEPPIKVLQTFALPLGDRASLHRTGIYRRRAKSSINSKVACYLALATFVLDTVSLTIGEPIRLPHSVHEPS
jgi:hypothetical protein